MWCVYALVDPTNGAICYVGKTKNARGRYRAHLRQVRPKRRSLLISKIKSWAARELIPLLRVLVVVESGEEAFRLGAV